ncbi:rhomboid family intramembrane serine protease [Aquimarina agarilytica]|uniref:rhomboid family intramembrane serine protease n=1 Tax=Aquimarina agarilytica TaxID=1087449 RepID=UPI000289AC3C|nr:rhomboid family intramembrane serine protease [Aquimarina agarilytica]
MDRITDTVKTLLIINVVFFIGSNFLVPNIADTLFALWFPKNPNFKIWQPLTHMFMHGGTTHLLFNMFALYMFGSHIERAIGKSKFIFLYFSAGFGAAALQILFGYYEFMPMYAVLKNNGLTDVNVVEFIKNILETGQYTNYDGLTQSGLRKMIESFSIPMVGASGAIFGVLVAFAVLYPNLPLMLMFIPVPIKAKYLIGGYFLLDVYAALTGNNIIGPANTANWAHIGGAVVGFIIIWYWKKNSFNDKRWY